MHISLETEGGFAHLPGLQQRFEVETSELDPVQARNLATLVRRSNFFDRPSDPSAPPAGAADYRTYTIEVEEGGRSHVVRVHDLTADDAIRAVISCLEELRRST